MLSLRRPIGRMTMIEQQLEGEFRYVNSRLIVNSEEIAFYQGGDREKATITHSFNKLVTHLRKLIVFRFGKQMLFTIVFYLFYC
jgi:ATP-binding cassette subfamily D (ALD) protein 3